MIPNTINIVCYPEEKKFDCEGIIAVGENVKLVFSTPGCFGSSEGMVVRVFCGSPNHKLLTMFPMGEEDNWSLIDGKLNCIANFNTIQLHEYMNEFMPNITYLTLELSNEKDGEQTLLCSDFIRVKQWDRVSEETPVDIGDLIKTYKDHAHTGEDGTKKISHNSLNDIGTKSHLQIEQELQELNSTTNLLTTNVNKINNQVSSLGASVGETTNQFLENKNEHLNFSKDIDEINNNVNDLSKKVTDTANNLQSKLNENSQAVENVKNKNYLQKTIADGLYLTINEYNKKVHCNILAPVKTINDLPSISDSEIGDIRLVLDDNMAYVRYYDDDGSGVNGWASLGIGMEELRKIENKLTNLVNNHINNTSNPHNVTAEQLTDKNAGTLVVVFDDVGFLSGNFNFEFDPFIYSRGNLSFTLNVGEYAPPSIANRTINYNGKIHLCENWEDNGDEYPTFVTEERVGDGVYFYVQVLDLRENPTTIARLFFLIGDINDATSASQVTPFGDAVNTKVSELEYKQGGIYQVLTEKILRDKATNKAYTLVVENGELKLQEYRISEYEA